MKLAFFSNFLNHHQLPFCLEMQKKLGDDYTFVAFEPVPQDRIKLGYYDLNESYGFVVRAYESKDNEILAERLAREVDILILGSAPEKYLKERAELGKLSFLYSERIYKTGVKHMFSPSFIMELLDEYKPYRNKPVYLLCAGAYVAKDYAFLGNFVGKTYKWGYFPEFVEYNVKELLDNKPKDKVHILWVGRFLDWKHPELAIEVAYRLKKDKYDFVLDMIGEGSQEDKVRDLIDCYKLKDYVNLLGPKHPDEVRKKMVHSHIFLFTSDRNEGWGAVLNEAMNSACAVVANKAIGSVPFLIKGRWNGLWYKGKNVKNIYKLVKLLVDNEDLRVKLANNAYSTIANEWNAGIASERIIALSEKILENGCCNISGGICSNC